MLVVVVVVLLLLLLFLMEDMLISHTQPLQGIFTSFITAVSPF